MSYSLGYEYNFPLELQLMIKHDRKLSGALRDTWAHTSPRATVHVKCNVIKIFKCRKPDDDIFFAFYKFGKEV